MAHPDAAGRVAHLDPELTADTRCCSHGWERSGTSVNVRSPPLIP